MQDIVQCGFIYICSFLESIESSFLQNYWGKQSLAEKKKKDFQMAVAGGDVVPPQDVRIKENLKGIDNDFDHGQQQQQQQPEVVPNVFDNAKAATDKERKMTLLQGIRLYPKAVAWSVIISTCIVMEGYDISLINNFYAFPQFNKKYGELLPDGSHQVPARVSL